MSEPVQRLTEPFSFGLEVLLNQYLLVMTACVDPSKGTYPLKRADPAVRLEDYKTALRYWLAHPDERLQKILFIENSAYPLDSLKAIADPENPRKKEVEFISLDCNWYPPGGHYGYAELRMLDLGLQQSQLRLSTTHMIKVSGRFKFPALSRLLDRLPTQFDAAADARGWDNLYRRRAQPYVTTPIILFEHDFYSKSLQECYRDLESGQTNHMEVIYYKKLEPLKQSHTILLRFPCNVSPEGFPAHRDSSYSDFKETAKNAIRAAARVLLPNWWI
jgi:hypothetical protein